MPRSTTDSPAARRSSVPGSSRASSAKGSAPAKAAPAALALSDDDGDEASDADADEAGASDDGIESVEEPEYEIEKILGHRVQHGTMAVTYKIRWKGYQPSDDTWEPETHVSSSAAELTREYWSRVKRRADPKDTKALKAIARLRAAEGKRLRSDSPAAAEDDEAASPRAAKKARGSDEAAAAESVPDDDEDAEDEAETRRAEAASRKKYDKIANWENECNVETLERSEDGELRAFIRFKDGAELFYPASVAYKKCPQKTLEFYERHLHFRRAPSNS